VHSGQEVRGQTGLALYGDGKEVTKGGGGREDHRYVMTTKINRPVCYLFCRNGPFEGWRKDAKCGDRIPISRYGGTAKQFKFCNTYAVDAYAARRGTSRLHLSYRPPISIYPAPNAHNRTQVTFGPYFRAEKKHLASYSKPRRAISLKVDDIGRRRLLTQPRPGRQLPVVSAFRVSEG
jgi:hypothetical protein